MSVHPDGLQDLVTRAHIARRLHIPRARVNAAVASEGFPEPLGRVGPSRVWRWSEVRSWAEGATGRPGGPSAEGMRLAHIRDHFRAAGFRLKITRSADGQLAGAQDRRGPPVGRRAGLHGRERPRGRRERAQVAGDAPLT